MAIGYEKARGPFLGDDIVWVDEPQDLYGEGPLVEQKRRHAAEVIKRMDASKKWQRVNMQEREANQVVQGPDGVTTAGGTPYADAVSEAMSEGAASVELVIGSDDEGGSAIGHHKDGSKVTYAVPPQKKPTQADVRAWATEQGLEVNPMGQVPKKLIAQYIQAHGG